MKKAIYKVVFNRKNKLNKEGKALIQIEAYYNGKRRYFSTNIYVTPQEWNSKTNTIKSTAPNSIFLNSEIKKKIQTFEDFELKRLHEKKPFTLEMLHEIENLNNTDFLKFYFEELQSLQRSANTKRIYLHTYNTLKQFQNVINFNDLNYTFIQDFENYLNKQTTHGKPLKTNTIAGHLRALKVFVNLAINKDFIELNNNPFRKHKITIEKPHKAFLTPDEVQKIEALDTTDRPHLQYAKDLFLFAVYTGLRFSDIMILKQTDIKQVNNVVWLEINTQKTKEAVKIPISEIFNGKPYELIKSYIDEKKANIFKPITNANINLKIKEIAKLSNLQKYITFHTSRHTTATYLLSKGVSIFVVQKILGHTKIETTQIYSHLIDESILKEIQAVNFQ